MMNEAYQAHDGLPPDLFPPDIPTYTGHYHKPHTVPGTRITYVGSPYQGASLPLSGCRRLAAAVRVPLLVLLERGRLLPAIFLHGLPCC